MKNCCISPIAELGTDKYGNRIFVKREDLIPFSFGGNKVRIAYEFIADAKRQEKNCLIGYGNVRSNLCRVLANMCAAEGLPCHIISQTEESCSKTANSSLVELCGAKIHYCEKSNVAETVDAVLGECRKAGLDPYYIYGDRYGKGNEHVPVSAYVKVADEILRQQEEIGAVFDYVFLGTGTGMTQAGLISGFLGKKKAPEIIGVSVSRAAESEEKIIANYVEAYLRSENSPAYAMLRREDIAGRVHITDRYLCGGYGAMNEEVKNTVEAAFRTYGMPLDYTYTGKAFYGMKGYIRECGLKNAGILFMHTGGAPLFFDELFCV